MGALPAPSTRAFGSVPELEAALRERAYLADRGLATAVYLALALDKPLLLEGEAGVGKTEVAKVRAALLGDQGAADVFGGEFLVERPLLAAVRAGSGAVLLIDELDRADDEFEAFLLEILSEFAVSIPEIGRVAAETLPAVVVTSNRTRELHDALK